MSYGIEGYRDDTGYDEDNDTIEEAFRQLTEGIDLGEFDFDLDSLDPYGNYPRYCLLYTSPSPRDA